MKKSILCLTALLISGQAWGMYLEEKLQDKINDLLFKIKGDLSKKTYKEFVVSKKGTCILLTSDTEEHSLKLNEGNLELKTFDLPFSMHLYDEKIYYSFKPIKTPDHIKKVFYEAYKQQKERVTKNKKEKLKAARSFYDIIIKTAKE